MKIAFIGAGKVGAPLALHLAEAGHDVVLASTEEGSTSQGAALARSPKLRAEGLLEAVKAAEVVFLATPFSANEAVVRPIAAQLAGKVLVDCTNPVGPGLSHGLRSERSGSELLQSFVPEARVIKAFSIYGFENFEDPSFPGYGVKPTMFFCGDDARARQLASDLIFDCGFDPLDVGGLAQALHLEHMTLLWVRMVRAQGHAPGLVWSALRRPKMTLPYSKLVVFGDGLSDQGRFYALTDGRYPPSPLFLRGRWTNGPTWIEHLSRLAGLPLAQEDNFAQGGATTGAFNINEPLRGALGLDAAAEVRGVLAQVDAYVARDRAVDGRALHVVWAGGHDIGAYLDFGQPDLKAKPPEENIKRAVTTLAKAGAQRFLVGNMPDMSSTPGYAGTPKAAQAREIVDAYNAGLKRVVAGLRVELGVDIVEFDGAAAFADIAAKAAEHGIKHLTEAFLPIDAIDFGAPLSTPKPLPKDREGQSPDDYFSFWAVSAGRRVHALLAQKALTTLLTHTEVVP